MPPLRLGPFLFLDLDVPRRRAPKLLPGERFTPSNGVPIRTMNGVPGRTRSDKRAFAKAVRQEQLRAKRAA